MLKPTHQSTLREVQRISKQSGVLLERASKTVLVRVSATVKKGLGLARQKSKLEIKLAAVIRVS